MSQHAVQTAMRNIFKKADVIDFKTSVAKRTNFDIVDVVMHIVAGFMEKAPPTEIYFLRNTFMVAAAFYCKFVSKEMTLAETIAIAWWHGGLRYEAGVADGVFK